MVASSGTTSLPFLPITLTSQAGEYVDFKITNPFANGFTKMYIQHHNTWVGASSCYGIESMHHCQEEILRAYCLSHSKQTFVDLWFVNGADLERVTDDATIPLCCHPDFDDDHKGTIQFTFMISCEPQCQKEGRSRRMQEDGTTSSASEPEIENSERLSNSPPQDQLLRMLQLELEQQQQQLVQKQKQEEAVKQEKQQSNSSTKLCSAKEYPCGLFDDMVQVCHYSTKRGYQTSCVSETDAEVLAFYPDDYCGPCTGGYSRKKKHLVL